jgi:hypothetical protein
MVDYSDLDTARQYLDKGDLDAYELINKIFDSGNAKFQHPYYKNARAMYGRLKDAAVFRYQHDPANKSKIHGTVNYKDTHELKSVTPEELQALAQMFDDVGASNSYYFTEEDEQRINDILSRML